MDHNDNDLIIMDRVKDRCHIFASLGMQDLDVAFKVADNGHFDASALFFSQQHPTGNGFYAPWPDKYKENVSIYNSLADRHSAGSVMLELDECAKFATVYVQLANCNRTVIERRGTPRGERVFNATRNLYLNAIRISNDESALKIMDIVLKHPERITMFSTDDGATGLVPEPILMLVAEAFAGLAMICTHYGDWRASVSFAVAALCKHSCALPFINCVRIVADRAGDVAITQFALLPFLLRTGMVGMYEDELRIWSGSTYDMSTFPVEVVAVYKELLERTSGVYSVLRGKLVDGVFIGKLCATCGKDKSLKRCSRCNMVYYCSEECQKSDHPKHMTMCNAAKKQAKA